MTDDTDDKTEPAGEAASPAEEGGRGGRRPWKRWVALAALVPVVLVAYLLGTAPGNRLLWDVVSQRIENASGWSISLANPRVRWGVAVSADDVEVRTPAGEPFARIGSVRALVLPGSLTGLPDRVELESVTLRDAWIDPQALPVSDEADSGEEGGLELVVRRFRVQGGRVATQELAEPVVLPFADPPVTFSGWSAQGVEAEGSVGLEPDLRLQAQVSGRLGWSGGGLEADGVGFEGRVAMAPERELLIDELRLRGEGVTGDLGLDCVSFERGPCAVEGTLSTRLEQLLVAGVPEDAGGEVRGRLDLLSLLGDVRGEVRSLPLHWALPEQQEGSDDDRRQALQYAGDLLAGGSLNWSATAAGESVSVNGEVDLSGREPGGREVFSLLAEAGGGGLTASGRLDLSKVVWEGRLRSTATSMAQLMPLVPQAGRDALADAGVATAPFRLRSDFRFDPESGAWMELSALLGGACGEAEPCPSLEVTSRGLEVATSSGVPDLSTLEGDLSVSATAVPGEVVWGRLDEALRPRVRRVLGRDDRISATVDLEIADGRIRDEGAVGELRWTSRIDDAAESPRELLLVADLLSRSPARDQAARVEVDARWLPALSGVRSTTGTLTFPRDWDPAGATLSARVDLGILVAEVVQRFAELAGELEPRLRSVGSRLASLDPGAELRVDARVDGVLTGPVVEGTVTALRSSPEDDRPLLRIDVEPSTLDEFSIAASLDIERASTSVVSPLLALWFEQEEPPDWWPSQGSLSARVEVDGGPDGLRGGGRFEGRGLRVAGRIVEVLDLEVASGSGGRWLVEEARLSGPYTSGSARGEVRWPSLEDLPEQARLEVDLSAPRYGVDDLAGELTYEDRRLAFRSSRLETRGRQGRLALEVPLAALASVEGLGAVLAEYGIEPRPLPVQVELEAPLLRFTSRNVEDLAAGPLPADRQVNEVQLEALSVNGALRLDDPTETRMQLEALTFRAEVSGYRVHSLGPLRLRIAEGRAELEPVKLRPVSPHAGRVEELLTLVGSARLGDPRGFPGDLDNLIRSVSARVDGPVDLAVLQEFMAPAAVDGVADVELRVEGPLSELRGELVVDGGDATVRLLEPYVTQFDRIHLRATFADRAVDIQALQARLNQGEIEVSGTLSEAAIELQAILQGVRYRVDYGLSTQVSAALDFTLPFEPGEEGELAQGMLEGVVSIDRGVARRRISLERELRSLLFAPSVRPGEADPVERRIDLDLDVTTVDGIRVRNNVADLRATWDELRVRGTLAEPLVDGVVEADPGGIVTAYGQVVRIDRGAIRFRGQPGIAPEIELDTTTSLEDPSIRQTETELDPFSTRFGAPATSQLSPSQAFAGGLADYLGQEIASGLGAGLGRALGGSFRVRPVLIFGESEPSASLIVTREINEYVDIGVSVELRNPEDRLYLIEVHDLPVAPSMTGQVFTNEAGNEGTTIQQRLELGGRSRSEFQVGEISFRVERRERAGDRFSQRRLRREVTLETGDPWYDGAAFDIEIDVTEALREQLYPSPEVRVEVRERNTWRDLVVTVDPGEPAEIVFEGLEPARTYRSAIRRTYRSDFYQSASLSEMEEQTQIALQAEGWLDVRTEVRLAPDAQMSGPGQRVVVRSSSPRRVELDDLAIDGLDGEGVEVVESMLASQGARVALVEGEGGMRRQILDALARRGWRQASLEDVSMSVDGQTLSLLFEQGPRARLSDVRLVGIDTDTEEGRRLQRIAGRAWTIAPGDPVVESELAGEAIRVEELLRNEGYADASVGARVVSLEGSRAGVSSPRVEVRVEAGPRARIAGVEVPDDVRSSEPWIRRHLQIDPGEVFDQSKVRASRRSLIDTGVFSSVRLEPVRSAEDPSQVTLDLLLQERPRWSVAYGLRWESEEGIGVVADVVDRNFAGRGLQLGGRALWTERRQAARLFGAAPRLRGTPISLEAFLEAREVEEDGLRSEIAEGTLQLAFPITSSLGGRTYVRYRLEEEFDLTTPDSEPPVSTESPVLGGQLVWDRRGRGELGSDTFDLGEAGQAAALLRGLEGGLGTFVSVDLSVSADFLASDFDYLRGYAQIFHSRPAFSVGERRVVWAQSWRLGLIDNRGVRLPREQRFFAGGAYSVRGYGREALGPQETVGGERRALGGEAVFVLNQELRVPITESFEGVLLFDSGNVWEDPDTLFDELFSSAGLGLRYRSPIGLLRLDVALPLDRRESDESWRYYLGFGHIF